MAMPESVPAPLIIDIFKDVFRAERRGQKRQDPLGWIISVPDTHQKTVLAALDKERDVRVLTCSTEDEANGVAAGLWMTGEPVIVMIQHAGLYATVNTLRGIAIDGRVPIFYMLGVLSRERDKDPSESKHSMVRYAEPLLIQRAARLQGPDDVVSPVLSPEPGRRAWPPCSSGSRRASRHGEPMTRRRAQGDRGRARCRDLHPDHDHGAGLARSSASVDLRVGFMVAHRRSVWALRWGRPTAASSCSTATARSACSLDPSTIAGVAPRNLTHLLFRTTSTSGSQATPGGDGLDWC
jgi:hypothetical protein